MITNRIFQIYAIAIHIVSWNSLIPTIICILFGLLAYRNIQDISYRTIPLVRRELDKQLTSIVLVQVIFNFVTTVPYVTVYIFMLYENLTGSDAISLEKVKFANTMTIYLFYMSFAVSY